MLTGIALLFTQIENYGLPIGLILSGGLLGIVFLSCFLAEKGRTLIIDADKIILPRGATINGKMNFQRSEIKMCEIQSVASSLHMGDGIISKDTHFHMLKLKDGRKVTITLYAYGKDAEREILETIKKRIV